MKKKRGSMRIIGLMVASIIIATLSPVKNNAKMDYGYSGENTNHIIEIKAEETIWRYRVHNGKKQKRLWSCTTGKWKTDHWIDV